MTEVEYLEALKAARPVVTRMLRSYPSDIEDVLQAAALRAWTKRGEFRGECKFSTWYTWIAIRQALMRLRWGRTGFGKAMASAEVIGTGEGELNLVGDAPSPEELAIGGELGRMLSEEIGKLSPVLRREALRTLLGGGCGNNTEKARKHRLRVELRERLRVRGYHVR